MRRYGWTHGSTAGDWISDTLSRAELTPYIGPSADELAESGVVAIFLGYFFEWDPDKTRAVAAAHGFSADPGGARTGLYDYADIDDDFISIHHWLKWYRFGFTRLYDNLSQEIRNGRMTRKAALAVVRKTGDETPHRDIDRLCRFLGISVQHFYEVCEPFRNSAIWYRDGITWKIRDFLFPDWPWAPDPLGTQTWRSVK